MSVALGPLWRLAVRDDQAYVLRAADGVRVAVLTPLEAVALGLMNGRRDDATVDELMREAVGEPGFGAARAIRRRLKPLLVEGVTPSHRTSLEQLASVKLPDRRDGVRDLPGPKVLHWWVTDVCPRRCVYCFADPIHGHRADDATLDRRCLRDIFAEAATLGAEDMLVAGGEPFLRPDLPEVMGDAIAQGITPGVTTKYPIRSGLARRLAEAGLPHICLSVDSFSPDTNALLVGSPAYGEQVRASAINLTRVGIEFSIECVVTPFNLDDLEAVVAEAQALGAKVVQVVPFEPVRRPIGTVSNESMTLPDASGLDRRLDRLRADYDRVSIERFHQLGQDTRAGHNCDIGMTKLLFTSDGVVHRCYKLINDRSLRGADLKTTTVAEAWHDPGFTRTIRPDRAAYAGSACSACSRFSGCHDDGRCLFQSQMDHGTYYDRDRACAGPFAG
jgi:MoaA/NifB/PqqE/SkfB family radical SAM enzyme